MTQQKLSSYLSLCAQFYDLIRPKPPEDAYAFYRSYVSNAVGSILEPMCGTGRFLLPLLQEDFDIHGFDASEYMLEALYTKAALKLFRPTVWHGFEDLAKMDKHGLIFIPSGWFGHIINLDTVRASLKALYEHLSKDGILVFESESSKSIPSQFGME
ncbi:class I SAM-dependent methyltransferase [Legionella sp.]|uniref:class I SAM-dependent methyltransferase n=1 Tax=Legionella sp. TaxID=459 RepID=UPI003CC1EE4B